MKTLDEIINRQDYIHINGALSERSTELAIKVARKMMQLEMRTVTIDDKHELHRVSLNEMYEDITGCSQILSVQKIGNNSDYVLACKERGCAWDSNEDMRESYEGDIYKAGSWAKLLFINNCIDIINKIDEYETNKVKEVENALEAVKNL